MNMINLSNAQLIITLTHNINNINTVNNHANNDTNDNNEHIIKIIIIVIIIRIGNWGRGIVPATQQADWWSIGAVGCAEWTGVLLKDVLEAVGVGPGAVFVAYYGEDDFLSRGVPITKALDGHSMLAWAMNGEPLPAFHGFPLRLLAPGFPGSAQGKWLKRLWVRDREHDGLGMLGKSYRLIII